MSGWFDNHCHLTSLRGGLTAAEAVDAAHHGGVTRLLTVGCDLEDSRQAIAIAERFDRVWATAGVHPHEAAGGLDGLAELFPAARRSEKLVAVGECGLDYYYEHSPRDAQADAFEQQIALAHEHGLALVIHTRDAWADTFAILDAAGMPERTVFHCFTGGPAEAEQCLERGAVLSFSGIVTFPSAPDLREAARSTPPDRLVVETDSPYLAPVPHRGEPNRPELVATVGEYVAELRGEDPMELAERSTSTAMWLYDLPA